MREPTRPRQWVAILTSISAIVFAATYVTYVLWTVSDVPLAPGVWTLLAAKTVVDIMACGVGASFLVSASAFLLMPAETVPGAAPRPVPNRRVALIYLCCDDVDWSALSSLARLSYEGPLRVLIHDDSRAEVTQREVDRMAARLGALRPWDVAVLRRPEKSGGKAGAVNYVLDQTTGVDEFLLICDNDSTVLDPDALQRALCRLDPPDVAGVQFRCVPVADAGYCVVNRRLSESIGAFHAFLAPAARFGWMPFIGHNALLRADAVRRVGGFTPGFFSDDLDLTVRLNLGGWRIVYAPEIVMGEKHPPSYTAFRKRSYKWAYGCVQTLRAHSLAVLTSRQFSFAEKLSFFQFAGFYCFQCVLLVYLAFALLAVPFGALGTFTLDPSISVIVGLILSAIVYAPLLSFYVKTPESRRRGWPLTLLLCGLVYGGTDFSVFRGVTDAFRRRPRPWIPTNGVSATAVDASLFAEAVFGLLLLIVPIIRLPELLYLPCWFLFAGKFLFGPALSLLYRDKPHHASTAADVASADYRLDPTGVFQTDAGGSVGRL